MSDITDLLMYDDPHSFLPPFERPVRYVTCRCCGREQLTWGRRSGKWRLMEDGRLHACPVKPLNE